MCHSEDKETGWIQIPLNTTGFLKAFVNRFERSAVKLTKGERLERGGYVSRHEKVVSCPCPVQQGLVYSPFHLETQLGRLRADSCFHQSMVPVKCVPVSSVPLQAAFRNEWIGMLPGI